MLNDQEKLYLADFLQFVEGDEKLKALARSVTIGRIKCKTREEAISCILLHTESLVSFFNFGKVSPTILLNYLHKRNIAAPGTATKEILVQYVFNAWKLPYSPQPPNSSRDMTLQFHSNPSAVVLHPTSGDLPPQTANSVFNTWKLPHSPQPPDSSRDMTLQLHSNPSAVVLHPMSGDLPLQTANSPYHSLKEMMESEKLLKEATNMAFDAFILQFNQLFYQLLNQPSSDNRYLHNLNESHFFDDCKMLIRIQGDDEETEVLSENVVGTLENLSILKKEHGLHFEPNLSEDGVRGKKDCHGLIHAMACGTLHRQAGVVGYFKQAFILRKDPFSQDSCKIVNSTLILTSSKTKMCGISYNKLELTY